MPFRIAKTFKFSASHQLAHLPEGHPCARLHGHNYEVTLVLESDTLNEHGMILDFRDLDAFKRLIDERYDHRHLNEILPASEETTSEALAAQLYADARRLGIPVHTCRVSETHATYAEYHQQ
jgi:6-pyruvoyltetrahydropterin/6-carboxytetrahydropterin synthase